MSLELSGAEASRPFIEAAAPEHPSLLDPTHHLDALFGVVNIPNVIWIDEEGTIVRPAEPGWPGPPQYPESMAKLLAERGQAGRPSQVPRDATWGPSCVAVRTVERIPTPSATGRATAPPASSR